MRSSKYSAMSCRRNDTPPPQRPPVKSWNWHLGGLLDRLTLNTGALDNEARSGDKRDRVDYDALAEQLIAEAERLLADRDNTSTEQLRSLVAIFPTAAGHGASGAGAEISPKAQLDRGCSRHKGVKSSLFTK